MLQQSRASLQQSMAAGICARPTAVARVRRARWGLLLYAWRGDLAWFTSCIQFALVNVFAEPRHQHTRALVRRNYTVGVGHDALFELLKRIWAAIRMKASVARSNMFGRRPVWDRRPRRHGECEHSNTNLECECWLGLGLYFV